MNAHYPTAEVPATPEYVLDLFRDVFRGWGQSDDFLTFATPLSEFATEWNDTICFWRELARTLNDFTGFDLPLSAWAPVLAPMRERTMGAVCRFIAERIGTRPAIRPWAHVTGSCLPAGAFLTARSLLCQLGAPADAITPSTPLREYLTRFGPGWVLDLMWMSPGRVPPIEHRDRIWTFGWVCAMLAGGSLALTSSLVPCVALFAVAFGSWVVSGMIPERFVVGDLVTFRDLAYCLAGQAPRRRIQPTP